LNRRAGWQRLMTFEGATLHVDEALKLLASVLESRDSVPSLREACSYIAEARFAAVRTDGRQAVVALDRALRALDGPVEERPRLNKTLATLQGQNNMFVWLDTSGDFVECSNPLTEETARAEMIAHGLADLEIG
jgi:hypothetical protein